MNDELTDSRYICLLAISYSSFLIFCCYFTYLKAREVSLQNMRSSENIGQILLGIVR